MWEELEIEWSSEDCKYNGSLVIGVGCDETKESEQWSVADLWIDNTVPLTNENIDKIVNFFNKFRS